MSQNFSFWMTKGRKVLRGQWVKKNHLASHHHLTTWAERNQTRSRSTCTSVVRETRGSRWQLLFTFIGCLETAHSANANKLPNLQWLNEIKVYSHTLKISNWYSWSANSSSPISESEIWALCLMYLYLQVLILGTVLPASVLKKERTWQINHPWKVLIQNWMWRMPYCLT